MKGMRLRGVMPIPQLGPALALTPEAGAQQPELPALSLTWGIYTFPGAVSSLTAGATKTGKVVGGYGILPSNRGFILNGGKFRSINYPGAEWTQANGVTDAGEIVGVFGTSIYASDEHGFTLKGTTYTAIDYPGATQGTFAAGINKSGNIVGSWSDNATTEHGFLLSKGVFTSFDVPGAYYTIAWGISDANEIVGWYGLTANDSHGFLYSKGTFTTLDFPGYSQNYVNHINNSGLIVGGYGDPLIVNGVQFLWQHCYVYQSGTFTTFDAPFGPPATTEIWHLNNYGVITGLYADNSATIYGFEAKVGP